VDLRVKHGELPDGEVCELTAVISVPAEQEHEEFLFGIEFFADTQERDAVPFLQLRVFSRQVQGLVCFGSVPSVIQVGKSVKRITLPLVVTAPVVAERLTIQSSESLGDAVISVISQGGRDYLAIDVAGGLLDDGVEDCWVKIHDPDSGRGAEARFLLEATPLMSVSPKS
jgi:hypothetical protein